MKRILITGAAGFLGSHLCDRFINEGFKVVAMDNLITGDLKNIEHLFGNEHFEFHHHDVSKLYTCRVNWIISCNLPHPPAQLIISKFLFKPLRLGL